jgi:hypothetical protein
MQAHGVERAPPIVLVFGPNAASTSGGAATARSVAR